VIMRSRLRHLLGAAHAPTGSPVVCCDRVQEGLSAQLDGEDTGLNPSLLEKHLAACPDCRRWLDDVARITRVTRVRLLADADADAGPELAAILLPAPRTHRRRTVLRLALLLVALAQLAIGVVGLLPTLTDGAVDTHHVTAFLSGASGHFGSETAAFNLAIGIALCWVVARPHRAAGPIPLLFAFVVAMAWLEAVDVTHARVGWLRLTVHLPAVAGLLIAAALTRLRLPAVPGPGRGTAANTDCHEIGVAAGGAGEPSASPTGQGSGGRPPAAHGDVAS